MLKGSGYGKEPRTYTGMVARYKEWSVLERGMSAVASRVPEASRTATEKFAAYSGCPRNPAKR